MKILIAEDNDILQKLITALIESWGYDYDLASNGQEAVILATSHEGQYDLCLMDIDMPLLNGCEATRRIRGKLPYFPIMAVTANADIEEIYSDIGIDDYLGKPYRPDTLHKKIKELTVKTEKICFRDNNLSIQKEMPMDQQHAQELKKLKRQGLIKMRLDGPEQREVIAHKNVPNKISHDFNVKKYSMTAFLNRDPERPTLCDLYRGYKNCIVETFLDEEDYLQNLTLEDEELATYTTKYFKTEEE